jgi:hypothetical protein
MELPPDAPKFKLAAVCVPRNAREARERARDHVRVGRVDAERPLSIPSRLSNKHEESTRKVYVIRPNNRSANHSMICHG